MGLSGIAPTAESRRLRVLPKQRDFIKSTASEVLYSGAFGAGKTVALCLRLILRANRPGAREGAFRADLKRFRNTTLRTLVYGDGKMPALLTPGTYAHHKTEQTITLLKSGGQIVYGGLDDQAKLGSAQFSGVAIDEATDLLDENLWTFLLGRVRLDVGIPLSIYGACNPGAPSHFLAKRFGLAGGAVALPQCHGIRTKSTDNPHLPPAYIANLMAMEGMMKKRYVEGIWCGTDGLVYDSWNPEIHQLDPELKWVDAKIGCDYGFAKPFAATLRLFDASGRVHHAREVYQARLQEATMVGAVQALCKIAEVDYGVRVSRVVSDPAAPAFIGALRAAGLPAIPANNDVETGIEAVRRRLAIRSDGVPGLTISPRCRFTIAEMESYAYDTDAAVDKVIKENDHAMDAVRYVEMDDAAPVLSVFSPDQLEGMEKQTIQGSRLSLVMPKAATVAILERQLASGKAGVVTPMPDGAGPIRQWHWSEAEVVAMGATEAGEVVVCGANTGQRGPVWQYQAPMTTPEEVARTVAGLRIALDVIKVPVMVWRNPVGARISQQLSRLRVPVITHDGEAGRPVDWVWLATIFESMRVAWDAGLLAEPDLSLFTKAAGYVYDAKAVIPGFLIEANKAERDLHCDAMVVRAMLWDRLRGMKDKTPEHSPPGLRASREWREKKAAKDAGRVRFG
jgi:phage terminase large subunit